MAALIFEVAIFVVLVITFYFQTEKGKKHSNTSEILPGPYSLPFIGGILQIALLGKREHNYEALHSACQKYGKTMGFRSGFQEYVITEDREVIKEILTSPNWVDRFPSTSLYHQHTFGGKYGLIFNDGESWREIRRFATRTLIEHGFGKMRNAHSILTDEAEAFTVHLNKLIGQKNGLVQVDDLFRASTLNVNWHIIAGERFDLDDKELALLLNLVRKGSEIEFVIHPVFSFPFLNWIPGMSPLKRFQATFEGMYSRIDQLIQGRRNINSAKNENLNFIDSFLEKIKAEAEMPATLYTDKQLMATVADLLAAASDTTANSLGFAILYMVKFPKVQKKVQAELDMTLSGQSPTVFDRQKLPYTEATLWEVMRMTNVLPLLVRTTNCDTTLGQYTVKSGSSAVLNIFQMHNDPESWGDPENFRPDRFLDSEGKLVQNNGLLNFGGGKRICIGQTIGLLTMFTFFASILQNYEICADVDEPNLEPLSGFTNSPRPFFAKFRARHVNKS